MSGTNPGSDAGDSFAAQPGVCGDTAGRADRDGAPSFTLGVGGELFAVRPTDYGGTQYAWLSGPNEGYGFGESPTPNRSLQEHRESVRIFLAQIDPTTGYIEDGD